MSDTDWWFLDLAIVIASTGALSLGLFLPLPGPVRIGLALPLLLFLPGYALVSVLFPDEAADDDQAFDEEKTGLGNPLLHTRGLELTERVILSVVFSVALVPGITLLTSITPWGITFEPVLYGITLVTIMLSLFGIVSRYRCSPDRRFAMTPTENSLFFTQVQNRAYSGTNPRPYNLGIALGIAVLLLSAGFAVANPAQHGDGYTEFAVDTQEVDGDMQTMYNDTYTAGETQELTVSITNEENTEQTYTTVMLLQRVNETDGGDSVTVAEETQLTTTSTTIADGETSEPTLEFTPSMQGESLRLTLLLYKGEPPSDPSSESAYREIQLPIVVE
ncbi:DUF1616 domain-containing protein [Natrialba sp. PRR66]|uniref:DUF1616 domain-containing protein n=1 Tax=Natrialba sp. PRR66 TaxID=3098146 RepID=UPI002B1DE4E3|nr:DUF1616 domain-containing protein [Natrialba sp. PRR66]